MATIGQQCEWSRDRDVGRHLCSLSLLFACHRIEHGVDHVLPGRVKATQLCVAVSQDLRQLLPILRAIAHHGTGDIRHRSSCLAVLLHGVDEDSLVLLGEGLALMEGERDVGRGVRN